MLVVFVICFFLQDCSKFLFQFFSVWQIELVFADKQIGIHIGCCVADHQFMFFTGENDADGFVVAFRIFFFPEIVEVEIHLPDITMLDFILFQINQHEALQNAVVKHQIHSKNTPFHMNPVLSADEGKPFPQFEQELL